MIMRMNFTRFLAAFLTLGLSAGAAAADFTVDGISYDITSADEKTAGVTEGTYAGAVVIPASVTNDGTTYSVTSIESYAFFYSDITSISIPGTITKIGSNAFYSCKGLTTVNLPEGIVSLGNNAFGQCSFIESINIPASVTTIGNMTFDNCYSLKEIYSLAATPASCSSSSFSRVETGSCTLYIPEGAKDAYNIAPWNEFGNIVETDFAGVEGIASDTESGATIYGASGNIVIENAAIGTTVTVYSANGSIFYNGVISDADTNIPVPSGIYIVKCGNKTEKVIL